MQIAFTGDVMLGRLINKVLCKENSTYVWGDTLPIILAANLSLINLECVISSIGKQWNKTLKMFHFRAHPNAINVLKAGHIEYVSLANNHVLDYETEALLDMLEILDRNQIKYSGAGINLKEAMKPAILTVNDSRSKKEENDGSGVSAVGRHNGSSGSNNNSIRIGIVSLTDNEPEWEATESSAGINYIPINLRKRVSGKGKKGEVKEEQEEEMDNKNNNNNYHYYDRLQYSIQEVKKASDLVIVSSHVGPHFRENPSPQYVNFAHMIIDMGADIYWGHSNHMPQGIEIYKQNKIIMYDCGDFIDDYAVDPIYRNDLSFVFLLNLGCSNNNDNNSSSNNEDNGNDNGNSINHQSKYTIKDIELIPTKIYDFRANTFLGSEADTSIRKMIKRCRLLGTKCTVTNKEVENKRIIRIPIHKQQKNNVAACK